MNRTHFRRTLWVDWSASCVLACLLVGCSANHYRQSADKQVYGAINSKSPLVQNMDPHFTLEQTNIPPLSGCPINTNVQDFLGPDGQSEKDARILDLEQALALAIKSSRTYQSRKEDL